MHYLESGHEVFRLGLRQVAVVLQDRPERLVDSLGHHVISAHVDVAAFHHQLSVYFTSVY